MPAPVSSSMPDPYGTARPVTPTRPPNPGFAPALVGLILSSVGLGIGVLIAVGSGGYALLVLVFGAPAHVVQTGLSVGTTAAFWAVTPFAVPGLVLAFVGLVVRSRFIARAPGTAVRRSARVLGTLALVFAGGSLLVLALASPLLAVEACWTTQPC